MSDPLAGQPDPPTPAPIQPSPWRVSDIRLRIELGTERTTVEAISVVVPVAGAEPGPLVLDGRGLELLDVRVDGAPPADGQVVPLPASQGERTLTVHLDSGQMHEITTVCAVVPGGPEGKGIWQRDGMLASNCEPQGFRRITWSLDRPANRATFDVTLVADRVQHPVLLSNGTQVDAGTSADGRHWARFVDPIPKPTYLFALVAGDLVFAGRDHVTRQGRRVHLRVAAPPSMIDGAGFALDTLAEVMSFDEATGGVEHDLDEQTFVAVPGYPDATEYHGLMFFDPAVLVLDTRGYVDDDLLAVAANVAHEYGHHTRGNRVTVRSWRELPLKEGLTVLTAQNDFRRHWLGPAGRVLDIADLRRLQHPEEITMGQPVLRAEEVDDPSQLYTRTTYLKGAEVFSMLRTVVGADAWAVAFATLVAQHDLGAAGVDDMLAALRAATPDRAVEIDAVARWFGLRGRPALRLRTTHDGGRTVLELDRTDALADEPAVGIPLTLGARDLSGAPVSLSVDGAPPVDHPVVVMTDRHHRVELLTDRPVAIAPWRAASAPIDLTTDHPDHHLAVLARHDDDPFTRWWATETLMIRSVDAHRAGNAARAATALDHLVGALDHAVSGERDLLLLAQLLALPDEHALGDREPQIDVDGVAAGLGDLRRTLGTALHDPLLALLARSHSDRVDGTAATDIAARWLVEPVLAVLLATGSDDALSAAVAELDAANPTRAVRALAQLAHIDAVDLAPLLERTYTRWSGAPKLVDRWIRAQTGARRTDTVARVRALATGPLYDRRDRGRVMAVWFPFATRNRRAFHQRSGEGYAVFVDELIQLMPTNAGIAVRLVGDLLQFQRFDEQRRALLRAQLERLAGAPGMPDFAVGIVRGLLA